jgi:hypothetical protein
MAISFIAGAGNGGASGTAQSVTHGLTLVNDDVLIGVVHTNNVSDTIADNNGGAAWTDVFGEDGQSGTHSYRIFRRVVNGSEGSTFDFTSTGSSRWGLVVLQFRGVDTASIFDVTPSATTSNNGGSDATLIGNDITVAAGTVGIFFITPDNFNKNYTGITDSYIERFDQSPTNNQDIVAYSKAYASGQATTTIEVTSSTSTLWDTQHFSINEAAAALGIDEMMAARQRGQFDPMQPLRKVISYFVMNPKGVYVLP